LLEVFAEMVSLTTVKRLSEVWQKRAPYKDRNINWTKLARTGTYIASAAEKLVQDLPTSIREGFNDRTLEERIDRLASIRSQVDHLAIGDKTSRAYQQASAHLILESQQHRWKSLLGIGLRTDPPPADSPEYTESLPILPAAIPSWVPRHLR
jgi:hypothetical protein